MNIIISKGRLRGATVSGVLVLAIVATSIGVLRPRLATPDKRVSCPSYLDAEGAAKMTCALEDQDRVGAAQVLIWQVTTRDEASGEELGISRRELVVMRDGQVRFSAKVERIIEGAKDQDMVPGTLTTEALTAATGATTKLFTNHQSGTGGYLDMFLIVDKSSGVRVHHIEGSRCLEAKLVEGKLRFEDWDSAWGELEEDYRPRCDQAPRVTSSLEGGAQHDQAIRPSVLSARTPSPTMSELQGLAKAATLEGLNAQLATLIYAGHRAIAWDYLSWVGPKLNLGALEIKRRREDIEQVLAKSEHRAFIEQLQGSAASSPFTRECAPYRRFKRALELLEQRRWLDAQLELERLSHEPMPRECQLKTSYYEDLMGHALYESAGQLQLQLLLTLEPGALKRLSALEQRVNMPPSAAREVLDIYTDHPLLNEEQRCAHMIKQLGPGSDELLELNMPGLGEWRDEPRRWLCPTLRATPK